MNQPDGQTVPSFHHKLIWLVAIKIVALALIGLLIAFYVV